MTNPPADETLTLIWNGISIDAECRLFHFSSQFHHIELRAKQPLPVTETGYRSQFITAESFAEFDDLETFIRLWLEDAATSDKWAQIQARYAQPSLFD